MVGCDRIFWDSLACGTITWDLESQLLTWSSMKMRLEVLVHGVVDGVWVRVSIPETMPENAAHLVVSFSHDHF
jgi:hypothetical protein